MKIDNNKNRLHAAHPQPKKKSTGEIIGNEIVKILRFIMKHSTAFFLLLALFCLLIGIMIGKSLPHEDEHKKDTDELSDYVISSEEHSTELELVTDTLELEPEVPKASTNESDGKSESESERRLTISDMEIPDTSWAYYLVNRSNPIPDDLEDDISFKGVWSNGRSYYFDERAADFAECMINDAAHDGVTLLICSAYRSYERQVSNFDNRLRSYASAKYSFANAYALTCGYIAIPGTSEHHTGLAVDFITPGYMYLDDGFEETDAYKWLVEHCAEYGFILRYPSDKSELTGINYEPWHFRFIGFEHAKDIMESGLCLEEYMERDRKNGATLDFVPLGDLVIPSAPAWYSELLKEAMKPAETDAPTQAEPESSTESESVTDSSSESMTDSSVADTSESTDVSTDISTSESASDTSEDTYESASISDTVEDTYPDESETTDTFEPTDTDTSSEQTDTETTYEDMTEDTESDTFGEDSYFDGYEPLYPSDTEYDYSTDESDYSYDDTYEYSDEYSDYDDYSVYGDDLGDDDYYYDPSLDEEEK